MKTDNLENSRIRSAAPLKITIVTLHTKCTGTYSGGSRGGSLGQLPLKRLWRPPEWRPFAINVPHLGVHKTRNRNKKYSKINNVFRLVERQDLRAALYPTSYGLA